MQHHESISLVRFLRCGLFRIESNQEATNYSKSEKGDWL